MTLPSATVSPKNMAWVPPGRFAMGSEGGARDRTHSFFFSMDETTDVGSDAGACLR